MRKTVILAVISLFILPLALSAQKVGFINANTIREKFPEAQQAEQRVQSMTEEWKRELNAIQQKIDNLEFEIKKNRLIWTDSEKAQKDEELRNLRLQREAFAKETFEPDGKLDQAANSIYTPVEEKIFAAVQKVAADRGFDIILDQSIQPIPYVNYKYDLTIHVLKNLGVEVKELEAELEEKIQKDPRNEEIRSRTPRSRSRSPRSRSRGDEPPAEEREIEREAGPEVEGPGPRNPEEMEEEREGKK